MMPDYCYYKPETKCPKAGAAYFVSPCPQCKHYPDFDFHKKEKETKKE